MITNAIVTAYCALACCCGPKDKSNIGITASGKMATEGRTIAAPRHIPLGSIVRVEGFKKPFIVEDRTARRYNGRWDIYMDSHISAKNFGRKKLKITYQPAKKKQTK